MDEHSTPKLQDFAEALVEGVLFVIAAQWLISDVFRLIDVTAIDASIALVIYTFFSYRQNRQRKTPSG